MMNRNFWLIAAASLVSAVAVFGAVLYACSLRPTAQQATNERVQQHLSSDEELNFQIDQQINVVLFFQSPSEVHRLTAVKRQIYNVISIEQQANQVVQQLIAGPVSGEAAVRTMPSKTRLDRLYISRDGIAYVIFNEAISKDHIGGTASELTTIYSIVNTLCVNFPSIRAVQIIVDGAKDSTLSGHIDISYPLFLESEYFALPTPEAEEEENSEDDSVTPANPFESNNE